MTLDEGVYPSMNLTKKLNLQLKPEIDAMLREISEKTGLKLVTIISKGIESEYREWKMAGWVMASPNTKKETEK